MFLVFGNRFAHFGSERLSNDRGGSDGSREYSINAFC